MSASVARGYTIMQTVEFIKSGYFSRDDVDQIMASVPDDIRNHYGNLAPAEWYPRDYMIHLLRGIAAVKNDDVGSAEDLANYGRTIAAEATNTFLKILMKLMTPALFVKKIPDFYGRDHRGSGNFEVDVAGIKEGRINIRLVGAEGFDHIGAASVGFFKFGIEAISGPGSVDIEMKGWSLATPSPAEISYQLTLK